MRDDFTPAGVARFILILRSWQHLGRHRCRGSDAGFCASSFHFMNERDEHASPARTDRVSELIAPPFTLIFSRGRSKSRWTARDWAANASFISNKSMSPTDRPAFSSAFFVDGTGPMPIILGLTPALALARMRTRGRRPSSLAFCSLMTSTAAAASFIPEAFPAETLPSFLKAGRSLPSFSAVVPARMCSSCKKRFGSPFLCGISTGTISSSNDPAT